MWKHHRKPPGFLRPLYPIIYFHFRIDKVFWSKWITHIFKKKKSYLYMFHIRQILLFSGWLAISSYNIRNSHTFFLSSINLHYHQNHILQQQSLTLTTTGKVIRCKEYFRFATEYIFPKRKSTRYSSQIKF